MDEIWLDDYELYDELEVDSVQVVDVEDSFVPLKISGDMILIKTVANVKVAGCQFRGIYIPFFLIEAAAFPEFSLVYPP